ncbi:hypothetical protein BEN47_04405 [Hymenobacter lapidarius]|uniref:Type I restriction enzyme R protein N-terminal domain-containing protein n=1 Tax=Hymenobacter lapidarius TaxID=1908237 RepID=A0A1G1SVH0_9BACT|nr:hypothetical protein [Hymenobacter lapidarius]OGX82622.1 hypothetical protein BEN47_04405 [Hymenobacter lapidarius]
MSISSLLGTLYQVLKNVAASAAANASILHKNEAATRAALIDPVLRALGWDTSNVQLVEPEKTINTTWRADYALHDSNGKIDLLLEAKCLGSNLEKFSVVQQLLSYAFGFGVLKVVVTDGITWHFYTEFRPGNSIAGSQFNLLNDDIIGCALQLVHWLDAAQSGHGLPFTAPKPTIQKQAAELRVIPKHPSAKVRKQPASPKKQAASAATFIELTQLQLASLLPGQKPKQLRLSNGTVKDINTWKDILLEVCHLVMQDNQRLAIPLPDKAGKTRFLFSSLKPARSSSTKASYQGKPIFVGTHYSAVDCIANAIYVAKQIPQSHQATTVAVAF